MSRHARPQTLCRAKSVEFGLALAADETVKTQIDENMLEVEPEDIVIEVIDDEDHLS